MPGSKIPLLAIHKIISHIWEDGSRTVNNDEPDLRFFSRKLLTCYQPGRSKTLFFDLNPKGAKSVHPGPTHLGPAWAHPCGPTHLGLAWAPLGPGLGPPTWAQHGPSLGPPTWAPRAGERILFPLQKGCFHSSRVVSTPKVIFRVQTTLIFDRLDEITVSLIFKFILSSYWEKVWSSRTLEWKHPFLEINPSE